MAESKTNEVTIELDGKWVFAHRNDDILPIAALKEDLSKDETFTIKDSSLTTLTVVFGEQACDCDKFKESVMQLLEVRYPEENVKDVVNILTEDSHADEGRDEKLEARKKRKTAPRTEDTDEDIRELADLGIIVGARHRPFDVAENKVPAIDRINALVGAAEFKALANEIWGIAEEIKRTKTYEVFFNQSYLFSIGDGCGLTTYLELFAELVLEGGLCSIAHQPVREEKLEPYRESFEPFASVLRALEEGSTIMPRILCVDISEWMDKTDNRYFKQFLRIVEKHSSQFIVFFRVPFVDKDILARIKFSLSDLLSVRTVTFPPLNRDEIKTCAEKELSRYGFGATRNAWDGFFNRISEEKSDGKFYGVSTVKKVVRELIYKKLIVNARKEKKSTQITENDARSICGGFAGSELSGEEQLNKLVGIDGIKRRVEEVIAQIELSVKDKSIQPPCIHMRFVGNPGTGKTTVARIMGKILKERGVLRVGAFFEYAGRDFCGRYIGETAPKTASICRDAYGSVLFIDEAYALYRSDDDSRDFGREAIDTLIAEMENHRNDLMVIMAGYNDDMDKLMKGNLGLASRMPYTIEFPNFTREQLYEIFVSMTKDRFKCDNEFFDSVHAFFDKLPDETLNSKEFSNARYVRNLFERTWAKAAMRCQLGGIDGGVTLTREDFEHASADKEFVGNLPKKTRIGFNI